MKYHMWLDISVNYHKWTDFSLYSINEKICHHNIRTDSCCHKDVNNFIIWIFLCINKNRCQSQLIWTDICSYNDVDRFYHTSSSLRLGKIITIDILWHDFELILPFIWSWNRTQQFLDVQQSTPLTYFYLKGLLTTPWNIFLWNPA